MPSKFKHGFLSFILIVGFCGTDAYGQGSVGLSAGFVSLGNPGDAPEDDWGKGWKTGVAVEVRLISFLAIDAHYGYHRLSFSGKSEYDPSVTVISRSGDPLVVSEFGIGVRLYIGPVFLIVSRGTYSFDYGRTRTTYIRTGDPFPTTTERQWPGTRKGGTDFGLGAKIPVYGNFTVSPQVHAALIPKLNSPNIATIGISVEYEFWNGGVVN